MFAGIDDHEIFHDLDSHTDDDLNALDDQEDQDEYTLMSTEELSQLDSHERSIMIKRIMERTTKTINQFDEDTKDEMADLRSLEDEKNRAEITKMIQQQERRSIAIAKLHKSSVNHENYDVEAEWQEEEAHIIDEQELMSVEIDNSQRQVDGLLHLFDESRNGAVTNLSNILLQLEDVVDRFRKRSESEMKELGLQNDGSSGKYHSSSFVSYVDVVQCGAVRCSVVWCDAGCSFIVFTLFFLTRCFSSLLFSVLYLCSICALSVLYLCFLWPSHTPHHSRC
jgi:hypothetical protein